MIKELKKFKHQLFAGINNRDKIFSKLDFNEIRMPDKLSKGILQEVLVDQIYYRPLVLAKNIKTIVDIGAQAGVACLFFTKVYPLAKIDAYEPNPLAYKYLLENIKLNKSEDRIIPHQNAVAKRSGKIILYLGNNSGRNSVYKKLAGVEGLKKRIRVQAISLETIIKEKGPIDLVKIDVEGSEYEYISTIIKYQKQIKNIIIECHRVENKNIFSIPYLLNKFYTIGTVAFPDYPLLDSFLKKPGFGTNMINIYARNRSFYKPRFNL